MLLTCEELFARNGALGFDVCIIGSGAAGLCLANELALSGCGIVVLEAGRHRDDEESQSCYITEQPELSVYGADHGRHRVPGGSTTRWGGQALPFDPIDFKARDWMPLSGWPISGEETAKYYPRAAQFMGLDGTGYESEAAALLNARQADFDSALIHQQFSKFTAQPDLRLRYLPQLERAPNIIFATGANVTELQMDSTGNAIESVQIATYGGEVRNICAKIYILCCGAIENARLLLLSRSRFSEGVGNASGWVGRCFQDHPGCANGTIHSPNPDALQEIFNIYYRNGVRYKPRFSASEAVLREKRIPNVSGVLLFEQDPNSAFALARQVARRIKGGNESWPGWGRLFGSVGQLGQLGRAAWSRCALGRHYNPGCILRLAMSAEQPPDPESRILLSSGARDRFGLPRAVVRWRLTEAPAKAIWEFSNIVAAEFQLLGLGRVEFDPWFTPKVDSWKDTMHDNNHHMGTTRMSARPDSGVVDVNCRAHSVSNLYIGGSSVFPTGGHSNPTLTLLALAMRLADHIKREFAIASP